jgi:MFS family permease
VISGTCVAAHDNAATCTMNTLTESPFLISLMSTVASLPFFLFTLPAGALADSSNRKKLVCVINIWLAATAVAVAIVGWLHLRNPCLILISAFFLGVGFAFNAPTWTSIVPQVVSDIELPSAATLSGLQFNISGILGPALGGVLVASAGASFVFAVNGACFLLVILSILPWKQPTVQPKVAAQSFAQSFRAAIRYVRCVPEIQIVLARNVLFTLFISAIPAVVPVVGLKVLHLNSSNLGLLFTSMGTGSVVAALFVVRWLRTRFSPNVLTLSANLMIVLAYALMGFVRQTELFLLVAALAGMGWTLSASELWVAAQRAMPSWVRGRMNATVIMVSQGAMVLGSVLWGAAVAIAGPSNTLLGAAFLLLISLLLAARLSINFTAKLKESVSNVVTVQSEKLASKALVTDLFPSPSATAYCYRRW